MNDANNAGALAPCKFCGTYPNPNDPPCATLEQAYARTEVRPFGCPYFTDSDRKMYPLSTPNAPVEPATTQVEWLEDAARYFEARPTLGEDMAHWANVHNAEMCRKIAAILAVRLDEAPPVMRSLTSKEETLVRKSLRESSATLYEIPASLDEAAIRKDEREKCAKVADDFAAYEQSVLDRTYADEALSDSGRKSIANAAGSRQVAAEQIAHDIRAQDKTCERSASAIRNGCKQP